jgi:uncharacterized membrane protein YkgB
MNREDELNTYPFSRGLGCAIILIGCLIALHRLRPQIASVGSFFLIFMAFTSLSFLVTTPVAFGAALGDTAHGFPYFSGVGRLVIQEAIMFGAAIVTMADSAKAYLQSPCAKDFEPIRLREMAS